MNALEKIVEFFADVVEIRVTSVETFSNPNGFHGPTGKIKEIHTIKNVDRYVIEITNEIALGFLIHEVLHLLFARSAWDHTFNGSVYNWHKHDTIPKEEYILVVLGRYIMEKLDIIDEAIESAAEWEDLENRIHIEWKQPGGDLLTHCSMCDPTPAKMKSIIKYARACGVMNKKEKIIGTFCLPIASLKRNLDIIQRKLYLFGGSEILQTIALGENIMDNSSLANSKKIPELV